LFMLVHYLTVAEAACMIGCMEDGRREELEAKLIQWAQTVATRDELIRSAVAAGITKHRVHVLTGIARTTVDKIVGLDAESGRK